MHMCDYLSYCSGARAVKLGYDVKAVGVPG